MDKQKVITVLRTTLALAVWLAVVKLYGAFIDPLLKGVLPDVVRMILSSMVVAYTVALGTCCLVLIGMPRGLPEPKEKITAWLILRGFIVQTGLAMPPLFLINIILRLTGHDIGGIPAEELFGNIWFYIVLLLIFNPVMEELLFRKILLERLTCLGFKWAVICSAVLFALPHVVSQGVPQMFYTFGLGLVWGYITLKTGKLWPAIILHSLSNIYGAFIPMIAAEIHPLLSGLFVMFTMGVMVPLTVLFLIKEHKKS